MLARLRTLTGKTGKNDRIAQITPADYAPEARRAKGAHFADKVAVIYAEGQIFDGSGAGEGVHGDRFAKMLREVQKDDSIKAVVLRVNSPGGSVTASEVILDELRNLHQTRPVVVSMGTVAASGGYYISTASDRIFAEPATITGSIGVFGLGLNLQKLANDHGVTFDTVKTGRFADAGTITRPMTDEEFGQMQELVDSFYGDFLARVAAGRHLTTNRVDELGQGRVWSGRITGSWMNSAAWTRRLPMPPSGRSWTNIPWPNIRAARISWKRSGRISTGNPRRSPAPA